MTFPNPFTFPIAADSEHKIRFVSNAAFTQRATISLGPTSKYVFVGSGEGVPMSTSDGLKEVKGSTRQSISASVLFEFSQDGTNFSPTVVAQAWQTAILVLVGTEDANDHDNNDTVMTAEIRKL